MQWPEFIIIGGGIVAIVLFSDNIFRHLRRYSGSGFGLKIFIIYIEIIKAIGGTFLTLLWVASCLFLYEGIIDYFGGKGIFVAIVLILPVSLIFYGLLHGLVKLMDAFPAMMHQNNDSDHDS